MLLDRYASALVLIHMKPLDIEMLLAAINRHPDNVPTQEFRWKFIRRQSVALQLPFGCGGLKNAYLPHMWRDLVATGFGSAGYLLARKADTYTKTEARRAQAVGQTRIKENLLKFNASRQHVWKQCFQIPLVRGASFDQQDLCLFQSIFKCYRWQRLWLYEHEIDEQETCLVIECVMPKSREWGRVPNFTSLEQLLQHVDDLKARNSW
jgi:hypothetical protein